MARLIMEIGELLKGGDATSLDGSTAVTAGGAADAARVERFRAVLPRVMDTLLDPARGAQAQQVVVRAVAVLSRRLLTPLSPPGWVPCRSASVRQQGLEVEPEHHHRRDGQAPGGV